MTVKKILHNTAASKKKCTSLGNYVTYFDGKYTFGDIYIFEVLKSILLMSFKKLFVFTLFLLRIT